MARARRARHGPDEHTEERQFQLGTMAGRWAGTQRAAPAATTWGTRAKAERGGAWLSPCAASHHGVAPRRRGNGRVHPPEEVDDGHELVVDAVLDVLQP